MGIGLKTWVGGNDQKVAEFGKLRDKYKNLTGLKLVKTISKYRNRRISITMKAHKLNELIYHVVKRVPGAMQVYEEKFDCIDVDNISLIKKKVRAQTMYILLTVSMYIILVARKIHCI